VFKVFEILALKPRLTNTEATNYNILKETLDLIDAKLDKKRHRKDHVSKVQRAVTLMLPIAMRYGGTSKHSVKISGKQSSVNKGRRAAPFWSQAKFIGMEWLEQNGFPEPGDGGQARLEQHIADWLFGQGLNASTPTIRRHVH